MMVFGCIMLGLLENIWNSCWNIQDLDIFRTEIAAQKKELCDLVE